MKKELLPLCVGAVIAEKQGRIAKVGDAVVAKPQADGFLAPDRWDRLMKLGYPEFRDEMGFNHPVFDDVAELADLTRLVEMIKPPSREDVGDALRSARLSLGMTQGQMAELLGIPVSKWSAVENYGRGVNRPHNGGRCITFYD